MKHESAQWVLPIGLIKHNVGQSERINADFGLIKHKTALNEPTYQYQPQARILLVLWQALSDDNEKKKMIREKNLKPILNLDSGAKLRLGAFLEEFLL